MQRSYLNILTILIFLLSSATVTAQSIEDSYTIIRPAQPTQTEGKVEVVEIFYYGCQHCYTYEPHLERWLQNKPENVEFRRMPAVFHVTYIPLAKAYYTAAKLGILDKMHHQLFDALHKHKRNINSDNAIKEFFIEQGVDGDEFSRIYNSREISTKVRQSEVMGKKYRIPGVPAVVINGKYLTSPSKAGSFDNLQNVINYLIAKENAGS